MTFEEFCLKDKPFAEHKKASDKYCKQMGELPLSASRARRTTLHARWARAAEARDRREAFLEKEFEKLRGI